ncbi:dirigent protein 22-like [Actinidia eriantha]|uniref:dirigent protein 22-like n=1 Tax=Actinidia eriantha TaxID=165200 RepID=UPI0025895AFA|nr:dirigent protein 22-like [Actinidia eriantha]
MAIVQGIDESPPAVEQWFQTLGQKKEIVTKLHFYFRDTVSGKNPTATKVAQPNTTPPSPTSFGAVFVIDDPLTVGPEPNSPIIGRAQGIYAAAGLQEVDLLLTLNYVFTSGQFNGSTLSILGRNPIFNTYRELPIVGGSGVFRLARGIATAKTYLLNAATGDAIVEYNVIVLHYQ